MVTIERKGSKNLAKSNANAVDQSYLGQAPRSIHLGRMGGANVRCKNEYNDETESNN